MTREIPVTQARDELAELINRVAYGHERVILTRHSKPVAGIVPPEDLAWLEQRSQERINLTSTGSSLAGPGFAEAAHDEALPIAARHTRPGQRVQPASGDAPVRGGRDRDKGAP